MNIKFHISYKFSKLVSVMKTTIIIFLIFIVIFVTCDDPEGSRKPLPKINRGVNIYNPRKFLKIKSRFLEKQRVNIKKLQQNKSYTVFPPISEVKQDVPNSPYFNTEQNAGNKHRVKKVLPELDGHYVRKRSVKFNNTEDMKLKEMNEILNKTATHKDLKTISKTRRGTNLKENKKPHRHHKELKRKSLKTKEAKRNRQRIKKSGKYSARPDLDLKERKRKSKRGRKQKAGRSHKKRTPHEDKTIRNGKVRNRRLIASKDAMIEDYPYVVSIQKAGEHWCSGALLNPRLVITTANCIWKSNRMSRLKVRAGTRYVDRGGQVARVQEVMRHPYWNIRKNPDYDIGLLLLDRNIRFSDTTHAVDLPNMAMYPAFEDAWVTSWGAERRDGVFENKGMALQVYHARLMDNDKCNNVTQRFGVVVTNNFICLAQTGRRAPCTRDTGAPAVSDGILWGLASWGLRKLCGTERYPAMFSYVGARSNLDFITNASHYLMADQRYYAYPDKFVLNKADTTEAPTTSHLEY